VDTYVGTTFLAYKLFKENNENILIYTSNSYEQNDLYSSLSSLIDKENIIVLPADELLRVEYLSESKELLSQQIYGLFEILNAKHKIILVTPASLFRFYPTVDVFKDSFVKLKVGDEVELNYLKEKFAKIGYSKVSKIDQSLQFASRGDIIDIYSLNYDNPIRIEFFDTQIESIRFFDLSTQTSIKETKEVDIIPGTINLFSDEERNSAEEIIKKRYSDAKSDLSNLSYEELGDSINEDITDIKEGIASPKIYKYLSIIQKKRADLLDFLNNYIAIVANEDEFYKAKGLLFEESENFMNELYINGRSISGLQYFNKEINSFKNANYSYFLSPFYIHNDSVLTNLTNNALYTAKENDLTRILDMYIKNEYKIVCLLENKEQIKRIEDSLEIIGQKGHLSESLNFDPNYIVNYSIFSFPFGFEFRDEKIVILTSKELFGYKRHSSSYTSKFKEGIILESYQDLQPGDYVVHEKNGIGKFRKISTLEIDKKHEDYLEIEYDGGDVLYVPLYQFNLVRKYVGKEGYAPKLNRLFTKKWETTKKKIKQRVNDLAERLMVLYSERAQVPGVSFVGDSEIEGAFARDFNHELTLDQKKSLIDIYRDMESPHPMDRLLCGDVGFGKTELAFRAAFRAILNGKIVFLLCPTTLLARQHYEVALERFKNFDVRIGIYTRQQTPLEAKEIEENVKNKKIDLIIGTHKILSKKLDLHNLGLLIIDEEQRFGVEQKERIKEKSQGIDVLTLSATPIPRTLQSSLVGLKSVSTIETPPKERVAIQTYVIPYDLNVVRELILREMSRHGQIFYVHNEVFSIYDTYDKLHKLVPNCQIGVIHGQMSKDESSKVMQEFYDGKLDLLIATSIIENGIDVENANLMIVENADKFGLAQLYQIKGRVGRGDRMAFAYLMINGKKELRETSQKRLQAIQDLSALGSGYKIAQRDLLIRGAGDILGPEQAGFIDAVGIDMYIKLLNEAVEERKTGIKKAEEVSLHKELNIDAYIPVTYINNEEKFEVYHKLLDVKNIEQLQNVRKSIRDIYGPIPTSMEFLFTKRKIDIYFTKEEFDTYEEFNDHINIKLSQKFSDLEGIGTSLFTALVPFLSKIKMSFIDKKVNIYIKKLPDWVELLEKILEIIDSLYVSTLNSKEVQNAL